MTAPEKKTLAGFLDITGDFLRDGYARPGTDYNFTDDPEGAVAEAGPLRPLVLVIGEGPGFDENPADRLLAEKAGQLLDKMLASIGVYRDKNCCIVRGENGINPSDIKNQIESLKPGVILCTGSAAVSLLLNNDDNPNSLRGSFVEYKTTGGEVIPALVSFHPIAILNDESLKRPAWEDLKTLRAKLSSMDEGYAKMMGDLNGAS